jgi:hypothetical protein
MGSARERLKAKIKPTLEHILGTIQQLEENTKTEKSSSTPLLQPVEAHRARSSTCGSRIALLPVNKPTTKATIAQKGKGEDLMEIDYTKQADNQGEEKVRRVSNTMRPRVNSRSSGSGSSVSVASTQTPIAQVTSASQPAPTLPPVTSVPQKAAEADNKPETKPQSSPVKTSIPRPPSPATVAVADDDDAERPLSYAEIDFKH